MQSQSVPEAFRIVSMTRGPAGAPRPVYLSVGLGEVVVAGREGDLPVGVHIPDEGVSRRALEVAATADGWQLRFANTNGCLALPWAQAADWPAMRESRELRWPRIAIRLFGSTARTAHWVLLEADAFSPPPPATTPMPSGLLAGDTASGRSRTTVHGGSLPAPLNPAQLTAVSTVFDQYLIWPPSEAPVPRTVDYASRRLGVSPTRVQQLLTPARDRAETMGWVGGPGLMQPGYLYVLARNGYLPVPGTHIDADRWR